MSDGADVWEHAHLFLNSERGRYIIGQALFIARDILLQRGDDSNARDAALLGQTLFHLGWVAEEVATLRRVAQ